MKQSQVDIEPVVQLKNVHKTYLHGIEAHQALRGITLDIYHNELVIIYGTSGGGKSTLLNIIGTIDQASRGDVVIQGVAVKEKANEKLLSDIRLNKLGIVFQSFNLLSSMSALENVELPMTLKADMSKHKRHSMATESLERVGLSHRLHHFPKQLSGGEQQRVAIARALANEPQLLLLDEPTGDLDSKSSDKMIKLLLQVKQERGITMVMVTHDTSLKHIADRVVYMRDGRIGRVETVAIDVKERARGEYFKAGVEESPKSISPAATNTMEVRGLQAYPFFETVNVV